MNKKFKVRLPLNIVVDVFDVPEDFEETIKEAFEKYTRDMADEYAYYDKLRFIDWCRTNLDGNHSNDRHVNEAIMKMLIRVIKVVIDYQDAEMEFWQVKNKKAIEILTEIKDDYADTEDLALKDNWSDDELRALEESIEALNLGIVALGGSR